MCCLEKTNITWAADVIDKLGWEAQRPLDTCWIQKMLKHVVGCPCQQNIGHGPGGPGTISLSTNSCLPIPLVLLTMLGTTDGGAAARAPRWRTTSRPRTERTGAGEDTGGGEYEG